MNNLIRYYKIHILKRDDDNMDNYKAFTLVMLVWTIGEFVSKKTQAIISSLFEVPAREVIRVVKVIALFS